jgi:DNA-directed RNA polymerase specialized sigma subunit
MLERYIIYRVDRMIADYEDNKAALEALREDYSEICDGPGGTGVNYEKDRIQEAKDDAIANWLVRKADIEEKINGYANLLTKFETAWGRLADKERHILTEFYKVGYERRQDAIDAICDRYNIERTQVYRLKDDAIRRLKVLMFG